MSEVFWKGNEAVDWQFSEILMDLTQSFFFFVEKLYAVICFFPLFYSEKVQFSKLNFNTRRRKATSGAEQFAAVINFDLTTLSDSINVNSRTDT